jgi:predicted nucleotidyltransferase
VPSPATGELRARLHDDLRHAAGLRLLVLYGSRARGDAHEGSDWDFGFLANARFDADGLLALLAERLNADGIDLTDLNRAGALLRHRVARDAVVVFEGEPGTFERYWIDAVTTWCDMEPVLARAYGGALERLRA